MFYENDRIVRKQRTLVREKARSILFDLESKGLTQAEIKSSLELSLASKDNNESQVEYINKALSILADKMESENDVKNADNSNGSAGSKLF